MPPRKQEPVFGIYIGEVVFDEDPLGLGRVRATVPELSGEIPLPWANPIGSSGAGVGRGFFNPPAKRDSVAIAFQGGDFNRPIYWTAGWGAPNGVSDVPTFAQGQEDKSPTKRGLETARWRMDIEDDAAAAEFTIRDKTTGTIIKMDKDGQVKIDDGTNKIELLSSKIVIEAGTIELGEGAGESVVLGDSFKTHMDGHQHTETGGTTSAPIVPMPASTLSTKVKAEF